MGKRVVYTKEDGSIINVKTFDYKEHEGDLDLRGLKVDLGSLEKVGGYLDLEGTPLSSLGQLKEVGEYLDLEGTQISDLGSLEKVGGYLNLRGTPLSSLGQLKEVGGCLDLEGTQISDLSQLIGVGGILYLDKGKKYTLPDFITNEMIEVG